MDFFSNRRKMNNKNYKLFLSGDGGYSGRFKEFKEKFGQIDFAAMECGQYNKEWSLIHSMPEEVITEVQNMEVKNLLPIHNSKFKLSNHTWDDPLKRLDKLVEDIDIKLFTPMIGEKIYLHKENYFSKWWENIENK